VGAWGYMNGALGGVAYGWLGGCLYMMEVHRGIHSGLYILCVLVALLLWLLQGLGVWLGQVGRWLRHQSVIII